MLVRYNMRERVKMRDPSKLLIWAFPPSNIRVPNFGTPAPPSGLLDMYAKTDPKTIPITGSPHHHFPNLWKSGRLQEFEPHSRGNGNRIDEALNRWGPIEETASCSLLEETPCWPLIDKPQFMNVGVFPPRVMNPH